MGRRKEWVKSRNMYKGPKEKDNGGGGLNVGEGVSRVMESNESNGQKIRMTVIEQQ